MSNYASTLDRHKAKTPSREFTPDTDTLSTTNSIQCPKASYGLNNVHRVRGVGVKWMNAVIVGAAPQKGEYVCGSGPKAAARVLVSVYCAWERDRW